MYKRFGKRFIDFTLAFLVLVLGLPVILFLGLLIYLYDGESPFFMQLRPGKNSRIFRLVKLRTMSNLRDEQGNLLPDEKRMTRLGSFIRKTSLDELPQLFNVLKGEMSLIGPRPLLVQYLPLYNPEQSKRHNVRPGITGWAQINGRNALSWEEKFALDVWYVDNFSFMLDLKIVFLTFKKVLIREGINAQGAATATYFTGNKSKT